MPSLLPYDLCQRGSSLPEEREGREREGERQEGGGGRGREGKEMGGGEGRGRGEGERRGGEARGDGERVGWLSSTHTGVDLSVLLPSVSAP